MARCCGSAAVSPPHDSVPPTASDASTARWWQAAANREHRRKCAAAVAMRVSGRGSDSFVAPGNVVRAILAQHGVLDKSVPNIAVSS